MESYSRYVSTRLTITRCLSCLVLLILFTSSGLYCQTTISGTILDAQGNALPGANVYIKDSYDGATTDTLGRFSFDCFEEGTQVFVASFIGFEKYEDSLILEGKPLDLEIKLKEEFNESNTVLITAGGFGANDRNKAVVLNPLDIVTTAGANGDIFGALQYLPGTTPSGEQNGLLVRGGAASETATIIDEMIVQQPFFGTTPDIPSRTQFNPFLFEGTFFSTGAYSARYGQALSSALILNTSGLADTSFGGLNLGLAGGGGSYQHKFKNTSIAVGGQYSDVTPFFVLNKQRPDWEIVPRSGNALLNFRHKFKNEGLLRLYSSYNTNFFVLKTTDDFDPSFINRTRLNGHNLYNNLNYKGLIGKNWLLFAGASYSRDDRFLDTSSPIEGVDGIVDSRLEDQDERLQGKVWLSRTVFKNSSVWFGGEAHRIRFRDKIDVLRPTAFTFLNQDLTDIYAAIFAEGEFYLSTKFALRAGLRGEYSDLIGDYNLAPRLSLAYKTGKNSTISLAYGNFYQTPVTDSTFNTSLGFEGATHYLANFQYSKNRRTFRVEAYYKTYQNLVRLRTNDQITNGLRYDNSGDGYARGVDVFWRDQKTFKFTDYWVSYSWLDTRRLYRAYPIEAQPTFVANHTFSLVYKRYFSALRTSLGASYVYSSGRTFFNPDPEVEFLSQQVPDFHNLSINVSYLTNIFENFTVVFASLGNVLGRDNIFGYRFSPDGSASNPVKLPQVRTFFIGLFIAFR